MDISQVSNEDGRACAQLLTFLKSARWELTGSDVDELVKAKRWLGELAGKMAANLKGVPVPTPPPEASVPAMKIKAMGPIAGSAPMKSRKKK